MGDDLIPITKISHLRTKLTKQGDAATESFRPVRSIRVAYPLVIESDAASFDFQLEKFSFALANRLKLDLNEPVRHSRRAARSAMDGHTHSVLATPLRDFENLVEFIFQSLRIKWLHNVVAHTSLDGFHDIFFFRFGSHHQDRNFL